MPNASNSVDDHLHLSQWGNLGEPGTRPLCCSRGVLLGKSLLGGALTAFAHVYRFLIRRLFSRGCTTPEERTRVIPGHAIIANPTIVGAAPFAASIANLGWMGILALPIVFEKTGKGGNRAAEPIGFGLVALGMLVLIGPSWLPTHFAAR